MYLFILILISFQGLGQALVQMRINYRINRPKVSHEIAVDLVNIFGTKNVLKLTYSPNDLDPAASPVRVEYQLGFLPLFYYRIDF